MESYYGHREERNYPLAAHIWGHRLIEGQHWIEYMLEFLHVLVGFDYRLGQGIDAHKNDPDYSKDYKRYARYGLRRFIFYDEREKSRHPADQRATELIYERIRRELLVKDAGAREDILDQVRSLLRSFSAIEYNRSWFAKNIFPVHESCLLWEAARSSKDRPTVDILDDADAPARLDAGFELGKRLYFARGGELYYLIISAGTEGSIERRERIGQRIQSLLTEHNRTIGTIAQLVNSLWAAEGEAMSRGSLGWIVDPTCSLYVQIAEDLDTFLDNSLDSLECFELLAHLIGFHIVSYIYHRTLPIDDFAMHQQGGYHEYARPKLLIDMASDADGSVLRRQSALLLREQEEHQRRRARDFIRQHVEMWLAEQSGSAIAFDDLDDKSKEMFTIGANKAQEFYTQQIAKVRDRYTTGKIDITDLAGEYSEALFQSFEREFRRNFLGVHRKIGKGIGLIAPKKGRNARFVLNDNLLKTLVMAIIEQGNVLSFGDFLEQLYERYGIIIGPGEARRSGLMERLRINEYYYSHNRDAFLRRLVRAGLAQQYSDATALISRG